MENKFMEDWIMEIKRCARCGCFFESTNDVCNSCLEKDNKDLGKLKNFLEGSYSGEYSREELSNGTGITVKNLNRFLSTPEFSGMNILSESQLSNSNPMGGKNKKGIKSQL